RSIMIRKSLFVLALSLLGAVPAGAQESRKSEEKPAVRASEVFHVYAGTCSRSRRLLGTYESADAACRAAGKFRNEGKEMGVDVTTGTDGDGYIGKKLAEYRVYVDPCKGFWLHATSDKADRA